MDRFRGQRACRCTGRAALVSGAAAGALQAWPHAREEGWVELSPSRAAGGGCEPEVRRLRLLPWPSSPSCVPLCREAGAAASGRGGTAVRGRRVRPAGGHWQPSRAPARPGGEGRSPTRASGGRPGGFTGQRPAPPAQPPPPALPVRPLHDPLSRVDPVTVSSRKGVAGPRTALARPTPTIWPRCPALPGRSSGKAWRAMRAMTGPAHHTPHPAHPAWSTSGARRPIPVMTVTARHASPIRPRSPSCRAKPRQGVARCARYDRPGAPHLPRSRPPGAEHVRSVACHPGDDRDSAPRMSPPPP